MVLPDFELEFKMAQRNAVISVAAHSKYNDVLFLSFLEQKYNRNCYRVVDRVNMEPKRLVDAWEEYELLLSEQDGAQAVADRLNGNKELQGIIAFGNCTNKFSGRSLFEQ